MEQRHVVAKVAESGHSRVRTYLNGQLRTEDGDRFYFHMIDVVHNVPFWLVNERCDPYEMLVQYISYAPGDVQAWFNWELSSYAEQSTVPPDSYE